MKIPVKSMLVDVCLYARLRIDCSAIHMYVHMHVEPSLGVSSYLQAS